MKNRTLLFLIVYLLFLAACSDSTLSDASDENEIDAMVKELRSATASFKDINNAIAAGWEADLTGCMEDQEMGGMGHHYGNLEYLDGRTVISQPQALMYEPYENGQLEFVGVEYIIPFDILPPDTAEPPVLFGQQYSPNYVFEIWALHVWSEKENPRGLFAPWNPTVSCQYAGE